MTNEELLKNVTDKHVELYWNGDASTVIRPMFLPFIGDELVAPVLANWETPQDKAEMIHNLRILFHALGVTRYVFFSESWAANYDQDELDGAGRLDEGQMPSKRGDRIEIIMTLLCEKNHVEAVNLEMIRDPATGRVCELKPWAIDSKGIGGPIAELLNV